MIKIGKSSIFGLACSETHSHISLTYPPASSITTWSETNKQEGTPEPHEHCPSLSEIPNHGLYESSISLIKYCFCDN